MLLLLLLLLLLFLFLSLLVLLLPIGDWMKAATSGQCPFVVPLSDKSIP